MSAPHAIRAELDLACVKAMSHHGDRGCTCAGIGVIDFACLIRHTATDGSRLLVVENEHAIDGLHCARVSLQPLENILG